MTQLESTLFAVLRSALGVEKLSSAVSFSPRRWKSFVKETVLQHVAALVNAELGTVPHNMPCETESRLAEYSRHSAKRFDTQLLALNKLAARLESENMRMMVLKGLGIALTYPRPELRECCDIDIFCFDQYDEVNRYIISSGLGKDARMTGEMHFGFEVKGIEVENHNKLCSDANHANRHVGKVLLKMSTEGQYTDPRLPGIRFPHPQMGALHLLMHTLAHLAWSGITLRHLCDVTMYLRRFKDSIDLEQLHNTMKEARLEDSVAMILSICNKYLGLDIDLSAWPASDADGEDRIIHSIFHPFRNSSYTPDPVLKFHRKVRMHRFRARMYELVYGEKYPERFLDSFVCLKK